MHKLGRLATAGLGALALVAVIVPAATMTAPPASAAGCTSTAYLGPDGSWIPTAGCPGSPGGGSGSGSGGGGSSGCTYYSLAQAVKTFHWNPNNPPLTPPYPAPAGDIWLYQYCLGAVYYQFWPILFVNGGNLTTQILAQQAYATLSPPALQIGSAPTGMGLVGLPEWFWLQPGADRTITATAALAGLSATVTARPGVLVINPGDGQASFACPAPGTAYDASKPAQQSDCTHLYIAPSAGQPGNTFQVTVSLTWTATWKGTPNGGGTLPPITRTATFSLPVGQAEPLYSLPRP